MSSIDALRAYSINEDRAERLAETIAGGNVRQTRMNGRGVVFLTRHCNLRCRYCKTREGKPVRAETLCGILESWREHGCEYLHLTGGEPTVHPRLLEIADAANRLGLRISLSTNATAPPELYERLVDRGLSHVYVSFDSFDENRFDSIVGVPGSFRKANEAIRRIVSLRDGRGADVYLTVNIVVYEDNIFEIDRLIRGALGLRPNDFKLIPTTRFLDRVTDEQKTEIRRVLAKTRDIQDRFPFFAYRLQHLKGMRGLHWSRYRATRCYLALDERTIDGEHYYPCAIYMREGGEPIGRIDEPYGDQAERIRAFQESHQPSQDPICRSFCCDITRDFNLLVHKKLKQLSPTPT